MFEFLQDNSILPLLIILIAFPLFTSKNILQPGFLKKYLKSSRSRKKNFIFAAFLYLFLLLTISFFSNQEPLTPPITEEQSISSPSSSLIPNSSDNFLEKVLVARVIDGDTIELEDARKLRYIGIDTPETKDPRKEIECFGEEAYQRNKQLVEGKIVELEVDISNIDKYGRLLRYVYLDGKMVNEILVQEGYAHARSYPPDLKYRELFSKLEKEAREAERGLWGELCASSSAEISSNF